MRAIFTRTETGSWGVKITDRSPKVISAFAAEIATGNPQQVTVSKRDRTESTVVVDAVLNKGARHIVASIQRNPRKAYSPKRGYGDFRNYGIDSGFDHVDVQATDYTDSYLPRCRRYDAGYDGYYGKVGSDGLDEEDRHSQTGRWKE